LLFNLHPERDIGILSERNRIIDELDIEEWRKGDYNVRHFNPFMVEDYVDAQFDPNGRYYILNNLETFVLELCHSIIKCTFSEYHYPLTEEEKINRRQTCIALAKDKKFQLIVHCIKRKLDSSSYENFIKYSNE
jgi:hypothetical protein